MQSNVVDLRAKLAEKMAGEIALSGNPGETIKKWRKSFEVSQIDLANAIEVSPSVVSDYESGRRKSPGTTIISKIVEALLDIDEKAGSHKIRAYESMLSYANPDVVLDIHEYRSPVTLEKFAGAIEAEHISGNMDRSINGYTIIDSINAIIQLSSEEFYRLYGWSTERALIFCNVSTGRSPMVALRVSSLKPAAVVLHGLEASKIDPVAKKIASVETFPLIASRMDIDSMISILKGLK
ncbi:MAG TPA: helix-turn-helix domain-containing protein [Methanocella sp.]|uniref:helix-turn-helix domain-containing protein n=1 Tax=Methanocella sp. TaxID=2052833 RepID=UPI002C94F4F6|nr:helix-turn-helix domain-containing protein [Methanocella sp.]HTY90163.1 helix-turn-helix domain-containing protein [Methanocella sp.]